MVKSDTSEFNVFASGSGKTFNQSVAHWMVVLSGMKRIYLYPPQRLPPPVYPATDSIHEWLDHIYPTVRGTPNAPMQATVRQGQAFFVPDGWHFAELNCQEGMSIHFRN